MTVWLNCFVCRFIVDLDSLTITDVTENDVGVYTCIMNTTLDHDSASAELTVVGMCHYAEAQFHWLIKQTQTLSKGIVSPDLPRLVNLANNVQQMAFSELQGYLTLIESEWT